MTLQLLSATLYLVDSILRLNSRIWCDYLWVGCVGVDLYIWHRRKSNAHNSIYSRFSSKKTFYMRFHFVSVDLKYHTKIWTLDSKNGQKVIFCINQRQNFVNLSISTNLFRARCRGLVLHSKHFFGSRTSCHYIFKYSFFMKNLFVYDCFVEHNLFIENEIFRRFSPSDEKKINFSICWIYTELIGLKGKTWFKDRYPLFEVKKSSDLPGNKCFGRKICRVWWQCLLKRI